MMMMKCNMEKIRWEDVRQGERKEEVKDRDKEVREKGMSEVSRFEKK